MASPQPPLASARWIVGGLFATLALAALSVYLTFCLLFWQGQWQLVFKPSRAITATPSVRYDKIAFGATETGKLELSGWWIPADNAPATILVMRNGTGTLSDSLPQIEALHRTGVNVFAFDYRGFGESTPLHPSEKSTTRDAEAAWTYLTDTRHLEPSRIALDGVGLGAAVAAEIAHRHPQAPALIIEDPSPPILDLLQFDARTRWLPVRLLFHDRFVIREVSTPKLAIYLTGHYAVPGVQQTVHISSYTSPQYETVVESFLGQYVARR
jgi:uncharacterized protein